eukprot:1238083-Prymnesium_polylepis.2
MRKQREREKSQPARPATATPMSSARLLSAHVEAASPRRAARGCACLVSLSSSSTGAERAVCRRAFMAGSAGLGIQ